MKICRNLYVVLLLIAGPLTGFSQENEVDFPPFTVESTFKKLKKKYPFIKPISPVISDSIRYFENITYKSYKQYTLQADIYVPNFSAHSSFPAVLLIHGGGWLTGSKENLRMLAQHLALNGYVAITANYRLGLEAPYPAAVYDIKDALKWMRTNHQTYQIDPNKIAILGASAGGQLATLVGVSNHTSLYGEPSKPVQAIVNIDGIVSFIHPEAASEGVMASIWLYGNKKENYERWREASPLEYIDGSTPPTLFINSSQPRFHAGRDDYLKILKIHNIPHKVQTIPNTPHAFWLVAPWFDSTLMYIVSFLNAILKA